MRIYDLAKSIGQHFDIEIKSATLAEEFRTLPEFADIHEAIKSHASTIDDEHAQLMYRIYAKRVGKPAPGSSAAPAQPALEKKAPPLPRPAPPVRPMAGLPPRPSPIAPVVPRPVPVSAVPRPVPIRSGAAAAPEASAPPAPPAAPAPRAPEPAAPRPPREARPAGPSKPAVHPAALVAR
ncbi:MAG: hypothetical protein M1457_12730, partial [bacterium]|nr:hypothetical protein [bacterium]